MAFLSEIEVTIDGESFRDFIHIHIAQSLYKPGEFSLVCRFDALEEPDTFLIEQSQKFLGKQVIIKTKAKEYAEDEMKDALVFRGIITRISGSKTGLAEGNRIIMTGYSPEILLKRKPTSRVFLDKTLKDVVNEVLQPYDVGLLSPKVEPRNTQQFSYIVQYEESDLDFLRRLSIRYGEWFYYTGEKLVFGELLKDNVDLVIGIDAQELNFSVNARPLGFEISSVDLINRETYSFSSNSVNIDSELNIYGKNAKNASENIYPEKGNDYFEHINIAETKIEEKTNTAGELITKADAAGLTRISGSSRNPFVRIGWNGKFRIVKERESGTVDYGEYIFTELNFRFDNVLNFKNDFSATPYCTTIPENTDPYFIKRAHPQLAVVVDNKDPEKLGRIRVWFVWMPQDQVSPWINILSPYVHSSSGFYFIPCLETAVLIDFEVGDIERPFCLGSLFEKKTAPEADWTGNYDDNNAKIHAIRTISGNTVEFNDSGGIINIYDKGNQNRITLDSGKKRLSVHSNSETHISAKKMASISLGDRDKPKDNDVRVLLEEDCLQIESQKGKIEISSDKNVFINAPQGSIVLKAKKILLDAEVEVKIKSRKVKLEGMFGTEIKGENMLGIKGGIVKIEGQMVKIN